MKTLTFAKDIELTESTEKLRYWAKKGMVVKVSEDPRYVIEVSENSKYANIIKNALPVIITEGVTKKGKKLKLDYVAAFSKDCFVEYGEI